LSRPTKADTASVSLPIAVKPFITSRREASSDSPCRAQAAPPDTKRLRRHERFRMFGRFRKFTSGILPFLNIPNLLNLLNMLNPKPFPTIFVLFVTARRAVSCLRQVTSPVRGKRRWTHHLRQSLKARADNDGSIARLRDSSPPQLSWSRQRRNDHLSDRLRHLCKRAFFHTQYNGATLTV